MGSIRHRPPARSGPSRDGGNLLAAKRNTHECARRRRALKGDVSENHYSRGCSIPQVISRRQPLRCYAHRDPDVATNIPAMSKNFGLRIPTQVDVAPASHRSRRKTTVVPQHDPSPSPPPRGWRSPMPAQPCFDRVTGFDVSPRPQDRNPALHRDRRMMGALVRDHLKRRHPSSMRTTVRNPRKADDGEHQSGHSSRRLPAGRLIRTDTRG
jgi:hypothetical protein